MHISPTLTLLYSLIFLFQFTFSKYAYADVARLPPVNESTIEGSWEAVTPVAGRVFRMEIGKGEKALLAIGWHEFGKSTIYSLISREVKEGKVLLMFSLQNEVAAAGKIVSLKGTGVAGGDERSTKGILDVELTMTFDEGKSRSWDLSFVKDTEWPLLKTIERNAELTSATPNQ